VFIDGFNTTRSKTRIIKGRLISGQEERGIIFNIDNWNTDGSSTGQGTTNKSDIILVPRIIFNDPFNISTDEIKYLLVMCDIFNIDGTPHSSNNRAKLFNILSNIGEEKLIKEDPWFGIEQEYVIMDAITCKPYEWTTDTYTKKQGAFYCSSGGNVCLGRKIAMEHMNACIKAGIAICGVNAEVAPSQWEFQIGICNPVEIGDHLWMARYILNRITENYGAYISYDPKPLGYLWNGSGAHTNFSISRTRISNGIDAIHEIIKKLEIRHKDHMKVYGDGNERRLTGIHETSNIDTFTYGNCDRG
jgi:glutamine synthetase